VKKFDNYDEVQDEVMTWFKGQAADFYDLGYRSWFQALINVWTMPANMLKNKVMERQLIHNVVFVNKKMYMVTTFVSLLSRQASYVCSSWDCTYIFAHYDASLLSFMHRM
jgi:hypothetical protein